MDPRQSGESHFVCHDNGNDVITKLAGSCISSLITDTIAAYLANYPDLVRGHTSKLIRGMLIILARYWVRLWGINSNPSIESICCYTQQHCWVNIWEIESSSYSIISLIPLLPRCIKNCVYSHSRVSCGDYHPDISLISLTPGDVRCPRHEPRDHAMMTLTRSRQCLFTRSLIRFLSPQQLQPITMQLNIKWI